MKQETLEEKLDKIVSKEPSKFWKESDERFKNKETLEEDAENFWLNDDSMTDDDRISYVNGFVTCAKWQQEQIGKSEFLQKLRATMSDAEARRLIFEQFKKK